MQSIEQEGRLIIWIWLLLIFTQNDIVELTFITSKLKVFSDPQFDFIIEKKVFPVEKVAFVK